MKKTTWKKHHKWSGIICCFFLLMFCLSGIVLNHRAIVSDINVGRNRLPARYHFNSWNGGLLRGTTPYIDKDSTARVLIYGTGGIWLTDSAASSVSDFNRGLPSGADHRQIKNVVETEDKDLFAVSIFGLYRYNVEDGAWRAVTLPKDEDELLTDTECHSDTLIVAGRSHLYLSVAPYRLFEKIQVKAPYGYRNEVSLFRSVWMLHSGELFGMPGRIIADIIALILIALCITGLLFWLLPEYMRRRRSEGKNTPVAQKTTRFSYLWHERMGRTTIVLTLFIAITGWCLRPPLMIPLALTKAPAVPGSKLDCPNPWNDKLRMIRYDDACDDWLLSASEGFYSLKHLHDTPVKISHTPPVSVMGLNVFQKDESGMWLCGSFSGMYVWDRQNHTAKDYFTNEAATDKAGPPFGKKAISGYSHDFAGKKFAVEYYNGTDEIQQPPKLETLPMSLWNVALEVHTGRIYIGDAATYFFIFIIGICAIWCLWSGWKLRKRKPKPAHAKAAPSKPE